MKGDKKISYNPPKWESAAHQNLYYAKLRFELLTEAIHLRALGELDAEKLDNMYIYSEILEEARKEVEDAQDKLELEN
jgi:hypothetical protein